MLVDCHFASLCVFKIIIFILVTAKLLFNAFARIKIHCQCQGVVYLIFKTYLTSLAVTGILMRIFKLWLGLIASVNKIR